MAQGELFALPDGGRAPQRKATKAPTDKARWTRFRGRRRLCDECTQLIHRYGQGGAPLPQVVQWRRVDGRTGEVTYLCNPHCREQKDGT